ncbi:cellulose biosynthesis protein BcsQ [Rhodoferax aquaticus]|uniref:Cellulose synthase operon protein YhjQ n=1 Tax=Rhodoferax aquaticus TaxID=2527691 RepID=A0A515EKA1_9BURK|nr:cellulose biosynthesis protein BcsQ [Rhodoferax aquaticus]QDL53094.1 cellulose synthase operon protein YhjQ [Rhodoferax aquaticus]
MQVIALISGKGGVGKTTLAANLAVALVERKKRVLLIDLDPQNAQRLHLGMDPDEIAGLVREGVGPDSIFDSPFGVRFIPFGRVTETELAEFESAIKLDPDWIANGIQSIGEDVFDYVILDTPPGPSVFLKQALTAAQRALVVILADAASYVTIPKIITLVEEFTQGREDFCGMHLLINQMPGQSQLGHQVRNALYTEYGSLIVPVAVHKDPRVSQALAFERPVLQFEPHCKASLDIQSVADWLLASMTP